MVKVDETAGGARAKVHYTGYKKGNDEWLPVGSARLRICGEAPRRPAAACGGSASGPRSRASDRSRNGHEHETAGSADMACRPCAQPYLRIKHTCEKRVESCALALHGPCPACEWPARKTRHTCAKRTARSGHATAQSHDARSGAAAAARAKAPGAGCQMCAQPHLKRKHTCRLQRDRPEPVAGEHVAKLAGRCPACARPHLKMRHTCAMKRDRPDASTQVAVGDTVI